MTDGQGNAKGVAYTEYKDVIHEMSATALSNMMDALSDMVCVCINGKIRHANATAVSLLGAQTQQDLLGIDFQSLICDDFGGSIPDILSVLATESDATPLYIKGLNGVRSSLSIEVRKLSEYDDHRFVVTGQNITRQVALSQAVRDSEARFSKLVDCALDFICVMQSGLITYINQAGLTLLQATSKSQVVGQPLDTFMHTDYKGILGHDLHTFIGENELIPLRFVDINQTPIDVEVGITILENGGTSRYMLEARDITAHNLAVTALRTSIETLEQRVEERTRELQEEVTERRRAEEKLRHVASHDGLTDLPNRMLLMDRLDQAVNHAHRDARKCAVLFIDLDGFKPINDTLGHDKGDLVLQEVAVRLNASIRETDTAARFGGDEFVLVLTDLGSRDAATHVAHKVLTNLTAPIDLDGDEAHIGASIGIAFYPDHGKSAALILKQADNAMYTVKDSGKNAFAIASVDDSS